MLNVAMNNQERARAIIQAIAQEAQNSWGENWLLALTNAYCAIEQEETGNEKATYVNRRSQIQSAIDGTTTPRLETVLRLAQAVELEVQLVATRRVRV